MHYKISYKIGDDTGSVRELTTLPLRDVTVILNANFKTNFHSIDIIIIFVKFPSGKSHVALQMISFQDFNGHFECDGTKPSPGPILQKFLDIYVSPGFNELTGLSTNWLAISVIENVSHARGALVARRRQRRRNHLVVLPGTDLQGSAWVNRNTVVILARQKPPSQGGPGHTA